MSSKKGKKNQAADDSASGSSAHLKPANAIKVYFIKPFI